MVTNRATHHKSVCEINHWLLTIFTKSSILDVSERERESSEHVSGLFKVPNDDVRTALTNKLYCFLN